MGYQGHFVSVSRDVGIHPASSFLDVQREGEVCYFCYDSKRAGYFIHEFSGKFCSCGYFLMKAFSRLQQLTHSSNSSVNCWPGSAVYLLVSVLSFQLESVLPHQQFQKPCPKTQGNMYCSNYLEQILFSKTKPGLKLQLEPVGTVGRTLKDMRI